MKIKTLSLNDFRAFPGPAPATFELDGKNLLVYGENGSGKSSLFHALRGMFSNDTPPSLLSLRNSFSSESIGNVRVQVAFTDSSTAAWTIGVSDKPTRMVFGSAQNGPFAVPVHPGHTAPVNAKVKEAAKFSAMLDYRSLLATNYKHGDDAINLFYPMVSELLAGFVDLATNRTIWELWQAVQRNLPTVNSPRLVSNALNACTQFNAATKRAITLLLPEAAAILHKLSPNSLQLVDLPFAGVRYNGAKASRDKAFVDKMIGLKISYRGLDVERPQNYLNEARLSALGLALYLGARLACTPRTTPHLKLLVLDDVLVGLDHSNRLPVLNVLKDNFPEWQIVLLTHDRGWFDLARQHLPSGWTCYEVYEGDQGATAPMPIVRRTQNRPAPALLQKARELLAQGYVEAAANYVRQAFETGLRAACELKSVKLSYKQDLTDHKAQDLLNGLKTWQGSPAVSKVDWDAALHQLELMKDVVMNPYSHPSAPNIPRQEVINAADAVDAFLTLARTR
ncbi:ATP-binding protein [Rhodoferax sp. BLA1]|uniref:AAA family ATPase n=1 Tax=Rhodoferax sp. BLA1 TaxID=2576062 RepID=UPI0015D39698